MSKRKQLFAEKIDLQTVASDLYNEVKRHYETDIASIIVGLYVHSYDSEKWPCEGEMWISWLKRRDIGDESNPINIDDDEPEQRNPNWEEEYIASALHLVYTWDEEIAHSFTRDITHHSEEVTADTRYLMKWEILMEWLDKQDLLDGAEKALLDLYRVRRETEGMKKVRDLLLATAYSNSTTFRQLLERYFRFSEALEIVQQLKCGATPVEKYAQIDGCIGQLTDYYTNKWQHIQKLKDEWNGIERIDYNVPMPQSKRSKLVKKDTDVEMTYTTEE
eukprot:Phypoly_transcript_16068.p1 GENE.Phypoly_transcript_16068~~Phypoly_transcript_16068.p1  ORF type:complete len:276 (+),score=34.21 Phypoly_transcript_16068:41-868(+)